MAYTAATADRPVCSTTITVDNISSMDGTSMTLLLSENEDAGHWTWHEGMAFHRPVASLSLATGTITPNDDIFEVEWLEGFYYPGNFDTTEPGETPIYDPLDTSTGTDNGESPLFINEGRGNSGINFVYQNRKARPSSGHPGVVIAAFCDGGTRPLRDDMDQTLFVRLCRPGSGVILNPKDLF